MSTVSEENPEEILMEQITNALEHHGYLPRIRAGLKVSALKKAQAMVASSELSASDSISPKKLTDKDAKIATLCLQLFEMCNLKKTAEMLSVEADFSKSDLNKEYLGTNSSTPVLCSLIE